MFAAFPLPKSLWFDIPSALLGAVYPYLYLFGVVRSFSNRCKKYAYINLAIAKNIKANLQEKSKKRIEQIFYTSRYFHLSTSWIWMPVYLASAFFVAPITLLMEIAGVIKGIFLPHAS